MNPAEPPRKKHKTSWPILIILVVAVGIILNNRRTRLAGTASASSCINNLLQIDGAKEQWALENKKSAGSPVTDADIAEINKFIKGGGPPPCPQGGTYIYNDIDTKPTCSFAGHQIED